LGSVRISLKEEIQLFKRLARSERRGLPRLFWIQSLISKSGDFLKGFTHLFALFLRDWSHQSQPSAAEVVS
jgi:hypothetical protein